MTKEKSTPETPSKEYWRTFIPKLEYFKQAQAWTASYPRDGDAVIVGYGNTPAEALDDFDACFYSSKSDNSRNTNRWYSVGEEPPRSRTRIEIGREEDGKILTTGAEGIFSHFSEQCNILHLDSGLRFRVKENLMWRKV